MSSYKNYFLQRVEGHAACKGSQPAALSHDGAHLVSYIDGWGAHGVIGTNREILPKYLQGIKLHSSMKGTAEAPPELRMQHFQQMGVGSHRAAGKLQPSYHKWNLMIWVQSWESGYQWLQAVQKGQERKERWRGCPLHKEMNRNTKNCLWRTAMSRLKTYEEELETEAREHYCFVY